MSPDAHLQALLGIFPCGVLIADERGEIVAANGRLHEILGYPAPDLVGRSVEALLPPPLRGAHERHRLDFDTEAGARAMADARPLSARAADGSARRVEVGLAPCPLMGPGHVLATVVDVTRREARRQSLSTTQQSEASIVSEVVAGLAHQFNNQLAAVVGALELALDELGDGKAHTLVGSALAAAERATQLTAHLLGLQPSQGASAARCHVAGVLRRSEPLLLSLVPPTARLDLELDCGDAEISLEASALQQLVESLVRNGAMAIAPDGAITVSARQTRSELVLSVRDDGPGFEPALLPHLTRPFVSTRAELGGVGLGLTSVDALVRQAGGRLTLSNAPQGGADATARFPLACRAEQEEAPFRAGRILVVDDERLIRETVAGALRREGHEVHVADGGAEAIALFERIGDFELLLTDVVMPDLDGIELSRLLRARNPRLSVLFVSGYSQDVLERHGLGADLAVELLPKPFRIAAVSRRVQRLLAAR